MGRLRKRANAYSGNISMSINKRNVSAEVEMIIKLLTKCASLELPGVG